MLLLIACTSPPDHPGGGHATGDPPVTTSGTTTTTTSWTVPTATDPPAFDQAALEQGLNGAVAQVLGLTAEPALVSYDASMTYSGGYCPSLYGYPYYSGYISVWYSQCQSPQGATYSGYVSDYVGGTYRGLYASVTVLTPDTQLTAAGYWASEVDYYGNDRYSYDYLDGVFQYDGKEARGTWIEDQVQPNQLNISRGDGANWHWVSLDGQYTGAVGPVDTVDFDTVYLDSRYACPEPTGAIALRTPDADWFDVAFGEDEDPCDGCGTARWRGMDMGQVCGDFSPWMTGEAP